MSEPLDDLTIRRLAYTEAAKQRVRKVDMPVVASPLNGTLHARVRTNPTGHVPMQDAEPVVPLATPWTPLSMNGLSLGDVGRIQAIVCGVFGVPPGAMRGKRRNIEWCWARQAAMALAFQILTGMSKAGIGRAFHHDHTTVMHAIKVCEGRLLSKHPTHVEFAAKYREAEAKARAALNLPVTS